MERYEGVKFTYHRKKDTFNFDTRLNNLNSTAFLLSELGLAPLHPDGAYGNHSYRTGKNSFVITKSGMIPSLKLAQENYCQIIGFNAEETTFLIEGESVPSSESFLHNSLYQCLPQIDAIIHGHSYLLNQHADQLNIKITERFHEYGTIELANSALKLALPGETFFILRDHGFVALGTDIDNARELALDYFSALITLLRNN